MKAFWCIAMLILQITCYRLGENHKNLNWRNIRKEIPCITSSGKLGLCLPPKMCTDKSNGSPNDISTEEYPCKRILDNPLVCCSISMRRNTPLPSGKAHSFGSTASLKEFSSSILVRSHSHSSPSATSPEPVSIASTASSKGRSFSKPVPGHSHRKSATISQSVAIASAASLRDTSSSESVQSHKHPSPSATSSELLTASSRSIRKKRDSNSIQPPPIILPTSTAQTSSFSANDSSDSLSPLTSPSPSVESSTVNSTTSTTTTPSPKIKDNDFASHFPEPPVCGVSQGTFSRVVGGNNASSGDFPWIAVIAYTSPRGFIFKCGGSLITSQHVLTAAHCMDDTIYFVRLGELDISDHNHTRPVDALVKTQIIHEKYNSSDVTNDIGILVFFRKVIFTDLIRPICLPLSKDLRSKTFEGYRPFVAGWGRTTYRGPAPTRLQMLQIPVVSQKSCRASYAPVEIIRIDERVICAGGSVGKDACNGDSGGPLMQPIWDPTNYTTYFYQTGVVSLGMRCGTLGFPGVYTRVTEFIPWIQKHVLGTDST